MYKLINSTHVLRTATPLVRPFHHSPRSLGPKTTQGHATQKASDSLHKDGDVQSASVRAASDARATASAESSGENEPFDAAKQGSEDGVAKGGGNATGAFKDQVGGQDEEGKGQGAWKGGKEESAGTSGGAAGVAKKAVNDGFEGLKRMREQGRNFSTSARTGMWASGPRWELEGARKPVDKDVQGDQNPHLKHSPGGAKGSPKQGNAAADPHLPSHRSKAEKKQASSSTDASRKPVDTNVQEDQNPHLKHSSGGSKGKPGQGNAAPDPHLPSHRAFSTSSSAFGNAAHPGKYSKSHSSNPSAEAAGYNVPSEALPASLKSAYKEVDPNAEQPPSDDLTPSSKLPHSSTGQGPPHEGLRQAALDGTLESRNPQPKSEFGRQGLDEAWKNRKVG